MKLLFILSSDEYLRNYGQTHAFRVLQREHACSFVVADRCKLADSLRDQPGFLGTLRTDKRTEAAHFELFNVLTWNQRRRSRTFYYRFSRYYKTYPYDGPRNILRNLPGLRQAAKYILLGNRVVSRVAIPSMIRRLPVNADLERILRAAAPDLVLFPCSAHDPIGNDLARLGPKLGFKTLFLVDNWDNLSSKSIFWSVPDFLGVWGEQSLEHAAQIHGIGRERTFLLGTPRFEPYYSHRKPGDRRHYAFPYLLFCGSALAFNELEALKSIDDELHQHPELYGELKVVYRPHPDRQRRLCADRFEQSDYRRVILDGQIERAYYDRDKRAPPALDYYPTLLAGAELVLCPLTTMLVEALICGTPVLAITYDDGVHYTSPHNAYKYYLHFEGIERMKGLYFSRDRARLGADLRALYTAPPKLTRAEIHASLQYFIYHDRRDYAQRLSDAVNAIFGKV